MIAALHEHLLPRPAALVECASVLDVGAGLRPVRWYEAKSHVCVEPFRPYARALRAAGYRVIQKRAVDALPAMRADAVYLLDVIEHMEREEGERALELAQKAARVQVVVFTPLGFLRQDADAWGLGGEKWQTHRSGWLPTDFPGWEIELVPLQKRTAFYATWNRPC